MYRSLCLGLFHQRCLANTKQTFYSFFVFLSVNKPLKYRRFEMILTETSRSNILNSQRSSSLVMAEIPLEKEVRENSQSCQHKKDLSALRL